MRQHRARFWIVRLVVLAGIVATFFAPWTYGAVSWGQARGETTVSSSAVDILKHASAVGLIFLPLIAGWVAAPWAYARWVRRAPRSRIRRVFFALGDVANVAFLAFLAFMMGAVGPNLFRSVERYTAVGVVARGLLTLGVLEALGALVFELFGIAELKGEPEASAEEPIPE